MREYASNRDALVSQVVTGSYAKLLPQAIAIADKELLLPPSSRVAWVTVNAPLSAVVESISATVPSSFPSDSVTASISAASAGSPVEDYEMIDSAAVREGVRGVGKESASASSVESAGFMMLAYDNFQYKLRD